jgi:3-hydroxybutyryl-CoA dehydratase
MTLLRKCLLELRAHHRNHEMNELNGHDIADLRCGMHATYSKTITEADIVLFAGVSGDNNAVHTNEEFAATTAFGGRIAHGFLTASVISAAVANRLPGPGTVYLGQQLKFRAPVRPGDTVHATVTVLSVDEAKARAVLSTVCRVRERKALRCVPARSLCRQTCRPELVRSKHDEDPRRGQARGGLQRQGARQG